MKTYQLTGIIGVDIKLDHVKQMLTEANGEDLAVDLASIGGYVYDGLQIFNAVRDYSGLKTVTLNGYVASIASYISSAFDKIIARDNSVFMIHNAINSAFGDYRVLQKEANELKALNNVLGTAYSNKTKAPLKKMLSLMDEETYFYGSGIKDAGFADEIIESGSADNKEAAVAKARAAFKALNLKDDISKAYEYINGDALSIEIDEIRGLIEAKHIDQSAQFTTSESDDILTIGSMPVGKNGIMYRSAMRVALSRAGQSGKTKLHAAVSELYKLIEKKNITTGGHKVDKTELLTTVATMKENAMITLPEIAKAMNLSELIITDEQRKALNVMTKLAEMGVSDPVAMIASMQKQERENSDAVRDAAIDKVFGITEENGVKNLARVYAGDKLKCVQAKELDAKINELKLDPIMQKFAQERADVFSTVNMREPGGSSTPENSAAMRIDKV